MAASEWFHGWLKFHKAINRHHKFQEYESAGLAEVYAGWIMAFDRHDIDLEKATLASRLMQAEDKRELFPEHHLARLLELARPKGPTRFEEMKAKAREADRIRRVEEDREQAAIKAAWSALTPAVRERFRDFVRSNHPASLCRFEDYVEFMARNRWVNLARGSEPIPPPRIAAASPRPASVPQVLVEPELTPGQLDFLAALDEARRSTLEAMTPARRRAILAPHADAFNLALLPVVAAELVPRRERAESAA